MKNIVVIGGGTGSYTALRGLKQYTHDLTAIVSVFDSGGSTGRLRDEYGFLPQGDVRRCILALAPETDRTKVLRELLQYRFPKGNGKEKLSDHNFGNLLMSALTGILGSDRGAIEYLSKLYGISGRVLPVSLDHSDLCARLSTGEVIRGENNIDIPQHDGNLRIEKVWLDPPAYALADAVDAVKKADIVVLGPGDLYTSIVPNVLVGGMKEALAEATAKKVFVCNVMTKWGETHGFAASDFLGEMQKYLSCAVDYMIVNTRVPDAEALRRYEKEKAVPVSIDKEKIAVPLIEADVLDEKQLLRHNSKKLAKKIMEL